MHFTEQQRQEIHQLEEFLIEYKRRIIDTAEALIKVFAEIEKALLGLAKWAKNIHTIQKYYSNATLKVKYKLVRRLDKCGYSEKEINLMVGGAHHCRNNC